jgi:hypothetical protein
MIPLDSEALRTGYEDLRSRALLGGVGPGLALFIRSGMREWLEVCGSTIVAASQVLVDNTTSPPSCASSSTMTPHLQSEIAMILAGLILQKRGSETYDAGR